MRRRVGVPVAILFSVFASLIAPQPVGATEPSTIVGPLPLQFRTVFALDRSLIARAPDKPTASTVYRLPKGAAQGPVDWYIADLSVRVELNPGPIGEIEITVSTDGRAALLIRLTQRDDTIHWSLSDLFDGATHGVLRGRVGTLHVANYLQLRGVHAGTNTLHLRVRQFGPGSGCSARLLPGSRIAEGGMPPPNPTGLPGPLTRSRGWEPAWIPVLGTWNYDFFQKTADAAGNPTGTPDEPVNLIFANDASVAGIEAALRPDFSCNGPSCASVGYETFGTATGQRLWRADRGVRTAALYPCPDRAGGPGDYHLRLFAGTYSFVLGYVVVGAVHIDCERAAEYGWQEAGERMIVRFVRHAFVVRDDVVNVANSWPAQGRPGCEEGTWTFFARSWHCMESDGYARLIDVPR